MTWAVCEHWLCHFGLQLVRSLQNEDLPDDGPVSLKKVFQFLHQVSVVSLLFWTVHHWLVMLILGGCLYCI